MLKNLESVLNSSRVMAGMGGDDEKSLFNKVDLVLIVVFYCCFALCPTCLMCLVCLDGLKKPVWFQSDAEAFSKKLDRLTTWLQEKKAEQEKRQPYEEPAVTTNEVAIKVGLSLDSKSCSKRCFRIRSLGGSQGLVA